MNHRHLTHSQIVEIETKLRLRSSYLRQDIRRELMQSEEVRHREAADLLLGDTGDQAVAHLVADLDAAAIDRDVRELRSIEAARERLKAGTYGVCIDCGKPVPWARLFVRPDAERCVPCAERHDKTYAHEAAPKL